MKQSQIVARLRELARQARLLALPSATRPEAFHEAKSELAHDLDLFADQIIGLRHEPRPSLGRPVTTTELINGRRIMVQRRRSPFSICV